MPENPVTLIHGTRHQLRIVAFGAKGSPSMPGAGGVERGIGHLAPLLSDLGFEFFAYARARKTRWRRIEGTHYRETRFFDSKNHAHWSHALTSAWDYLAGRRDPSDVIIIHSIDKAFLCPLFSALGHRVIFVLHGREWRAAKWGPVMQRYMQLCKTPMLRYSDTVVTVCRPSLDELAQSHPQYAHKLVYLPNGLPTFANQDLDQATLDKLRVAPNRFFLYSGRLVPQKRLDLVLEALGDLPGNMPLVVAGSLSHSRPYVDRLQSIILANQLEDRVRFAGHCSLVQLFTLYSSCRALVLPSETEGCSQTLLEALACGSAVICSDIPENRDVAGDAAIYATTGNSESILQAMKQIEQDTVLQAFRRHATKRAKELQGWPGIARKFGELSTLHVPLISENARL